MTDFLQMLPRPLSVALADYVAVTGEDELQRLAIAKRIYTTLPAEQQAEISRICEDLNANGAANQRPVPEAAALRVDEHSSKFRQTWQHREIFRT